MHISSVERASEPGVGGGGGCGMLKSIICYGRCLLVRGRAFFGGGVLSGLTKHFGWSDGGWWLDGRGPDQIAAEEGHEEDVSE